MFQQNTVVLLILFIKNLTSSESPCVGGWKEKKLFFFNMHTNLQKNTVFIHNNLVATRFYTDNCKRMVQFLKEKCVATRFYTDNCKRLVHFLQGKCVATWTSCITCTYVHIYLEKGKKTMLSNLFFVSLSESISVWRRRKKDLSESFSVWRTKKQFSPQMCSLGKYSNTWPKINISGALFQNLNPFPLGWRLELFLVSAASLEP